MVAVLKYSPLSLPEDGKCILCHASGNGLGRQVEIASPHGPLHGLQAGIDGGKCLPTPVGAFNEEVALPARTGIRPLPVPSAHPL